MAVLHTGHVIESRYEVLYLLGKGAITEVYLARDRELGRQVAVNVLQAQYAADPKFVDRFKQKAQSAATLEHPNIATIHDVGSEDGLPYVVMEYVPGETLRDYIETKGILPLDEARSIALQIAAALEHAHSMGLVHRDLNLDNIRITQSRTVKVMDFMIAEVTADQSNTDPQQGLISAAYHAPEQAKGAEPRPQSDLYSLGVILYEMVTGQLPSNSENGLPVPPRRVNQRIAPELSGVVMRALKKDPARRFPSATEMAQALERLSVTDNASKREIITQRMNLFAAIFALVAAVLTLVAIFPQILGPEKITTTTQVDSTIIVPSVTPASQPVFGNATDWGFQEMATATAAQAVATTLAQTAKLAYGPTSGSLVHSDSAATIKSANVNMRNFIVTAQFHNPYESSEHPWDYGFLFRDTSTDSDEYRLVVNSDKSWNLSLGYASGTGPHYDTVQSGNISELNVSKEGYNQIDIIVVNDRGLLFVNDKYVSMLDVSGNLAAGNVLVVTGSFLGHTIDGRSTLYDDFIVWELK